MTDEITIRFPTRTTPEQAVRAWRSRAFFIKVRGGWGCGKTFWLVHWALKKAAMNPGRRGILVEPTSSMVSDVLIPTIEEVCELHGIEAHLRFSGGRQSWTIPEFGFRYMLRSGDKPHRLLGPTLAVAGIDEAGQQKHGVFSKVSGRVRDKRAPDPGMACTGTPDDMTSWFYQEWKRQRGNPNYAEYNWTTYDNQANLRPGYIDDLKSTLDELHFRAFVLGEDVNLASGVVFSNFTEANLRTGVRPVPGDRKRGFNGEELIWTMDFNVDPMTAVLWVQRGDRVYAVHEIVLRHSHLTETIEAMRAAFPFSTWPRQTVVPDATGSNHTSIAGFSHVDMLREAGYQARFKHVRFEQDAITAARRMICDAAGRRRLFIDPERCPKLVISMQTWGYKPGGLVTQEREYAGDDLLYFVPHLADNVKYLCHTLFPYRKPKWRLG